MKKEIEDIVGISTEHAVLASAKDGTGTKEVLESIVALMPPPKSPEDSKLKALIFDSWFDSYQGVVLLVRIYEGMVRLGMGIKLMATGKKYEVRKIGTFSPQAIELERLETGQVGFITASIKEIGEAGVGDTITEASDPTKNPLEGFKVIKPMVFSGLYPIDTGDYDKLKEGLEKLKLNDSSLVYEPETSIALGFGFRCGFLGLLHMEIVRERVEREFEVNLITTAPTVIYKAIYPGGREVYVDNPSELPTGDRSARFQEPYVLVSVHTPSDYLGQIFDLCEKKRGIQKNLSYVTENRAIIEYELPLAEIVYDFYDTLKSVTKGYASMDYEPAGYKDSNLIKLDILVNGNPVDALSIISHKDKAYERGRELIVKLRSLIPRQLYEVAIQAAIGSRVIARESVKAMRKDVTSKCYGGDVTRKRKLLEKQKEGKKRMKQVGRVEIPQEAFLAVLKND